MFKQVFPLSALLIASVASAAGGGAGGAAGGGAHVSGGHGRSSFGNPAVENNTFPGVRARPGCLGGVAGVPSTGAPWPVAPPSKTNPSQTNGLAVEGTAQRNSDLPRLTQQDERTIAAIKLGNEKLGAVGNATNGWTKNRQPSLQSNVIGTNDGIQRRNSGPFRPLAPLALGDSSAVKETTDPRSVQGQTGCQPHE
jgi:hypothetical protein